LAIDYLSHFRLGIVAAQPLAVVVVGVLVACCGSLVVGGLDHSLQEEVGRHKDFVEAVVAAVVRSCLSAHIERVVSSVLAECKDRCIADYYYVGKGRCCYMTLAAEPVSSVDLVGILLALAAGEVGDCSCLAVSGFALVEEAVVQVC